MYVYETKQEEKVLKQEKGNTSLVVCNTVCQPTVCRCYLRIYINIYVLILVYLNMKCALKQIKKYKNEVVKI